MKLHAALGSVIMLISPPPDRVPLDEDLSSSLISSTTSDSSSAPLWGLWVSAFLEAKHRRGIEHATRFLEEATALGSACWLDRCMSAVSLHILGESRARFRTWIASLVERSLAALKLGGSRSISGSQRWPFSHGFCGCSGGFNKPRR